MMLRKSVKKKFNWFSLISLTYKVCKADIHSVTGNKLFRDMQDMILQCGRSLCFRVVIQWLGVDKASEMLLLENIIRVL